MRGVLLIMAALTGCQAIAGLDDFKSAAPGQGGSGAEGGGTTLPLCDDGSVCVPPVPSGWSGPSCGQLYDEPDGACGEAFPDESFFGGVGSVTNAACEGCECGAASGGACTYKVDIHNAPDCDGAPSFADVVVASRCTPIAAGTSVFAHPATVEGGSCRVSGGEPTGLAPFDQHVRLCDGDATGAESCSGDGTCMALDPACAYCIWRDGDVTCPPGPFSAKVVVASYDDQRTCGTCSCAPPTGGSCPGGWEVRTFNGSSCAPLNQISSAQSGFCGGGTQQFSFARVSVGASVVREGSCLPQGGETGEVVFTSDRTVCCAM